MAVNPKSIENLKPAWKPGEKPEGAGRPKGSPNRKTLLQKWTSVSSSNGTVEDDIAIALIRQANKGDVAAIKEVLDTLHGKLVEKSEVAVTELASSADDVAKRYVERARKK